MKVVFMGTPEFAVPCLEVLVEGGYSVTGVVTQPDKPQGRKMKLTPPPVKVRALEYGIPVFQPQKMREVGVLEQLTAWEPEVIVVVAYGKILPKEILELPKFGCINIHASLLPKYRGAGHHSVERAQRRNRNRGHLHVYGTGTGHRGYDPQSIHPDWGK